MLVGEPSTLRRQHALDLGVVELRAPVPVVHDEASRLAERVMPGVERRAQRRTVVGRRRLDVDLAERGALANLPVEHAVHRTAAGQTEAGWPCALMKTVENVQRGVPEGTLERGTEGL